MRSIDELGMRAVMQAALADVDEHPPAPELRDGLDPTIAPAWARQCAAAPPTETQLFMEMLADSGALGSVDIMELNPALDLRNQTAELAVVDLLESLFGKSR